MVIIIGAGITGLTLAYELEKQEKPYLLIDKSKNVGGYLKTIHTGGNILELGANSLLADNELIALLQELGLEQQIQYSNGVSKSRYVLKNKKYRILPSTPLQLLFGSYFNFNTKIKVIKEFFKPFLKVEAETIAQFFKRRFSDEIVQYAVDPFVSGIYAGDSDKLSIDATFPNLKKYEFEFGSVLKGLIRNSKSIERKKSINFTGGMEMFPNALLSKLKPENVMLDTEIASISREDGRWQIAAKQKNMVFDATAVIFCLPSFQLKTLLPSHYAVDNISSIRYAPMAVVHSVYKKKDVKHALNGFGGLNPTIENQFSLGGIWTSSVFDGKCKPDEVLFTTFVGGDRQKHKLVENEPWEIKLKVHQELCRNFEIKSEIPEFQHFYLWEKALPQYENSIFLAWRQATALEKDNIYICANWKDGVSLSDCIKKAKILAQSLPH